MSLLEKVGAGEAAGRVPENQLSLDTFALGDKKEERGRSPQENSVTINEIAGHVRERYNRAKQARLSIETQWTNSFNNYRGVDSATSTMLVTSRSREFVKITKTKVLAGYQSVLDIIFSNGGIPLSVEATRRPDGTLEDANIETNPENQKTYKEPAISPYGFPGDGNDPEPGSTRSTLADRAKEYFNRKMEQLKTTTLGGLRDNETFNVGRSDSPTAINIEPAVEAASKMTKTVQDQLDECNADRQLRQAIFEMCLLGTGIMKSPVTEYHEVVDWADPEGPTVQYKIMPEVKFVSCWSVYPDPDAMTPDDLTYVVERHRLSRAELGKLKNSPNFRPTAIDTVLEKGFNYTPESWETTIRDTSLTGISPERFEALEYWGLIDKSMAERAGLDLPKEFDDQAFVHVNVWECNGELIRLVVNPFLPRRLPYMFCPCEVQPYSVWGIGIAMNMEDAQRLANGFLRMAVDNQALSGNSMFEVDESMMSPGQDYSTAPGKFFFRNGGQPGTAIHALDIPNNSDKAIALYEKAIELGDSSSGIPSFQHGNMQGNASIGRTSSGLSMLMSASASGIRSMVKNIDDYLLRPMGESLFYFNMQFNADETIKGDLFVKALGTESLMKNEIKSQRLSTLLQLVQNPTLLPFIDVQYVLRETVKSMELDPDKATKTAPDALRQAALLAMIQQRAQAAPAQGGQPQQANAQQEQRPVSTPGGEGFSAAANPGPAAQEETQ
jgi:hypothetical protein